MKQNYFNDICYERAQSIWWSVGSCLLPSELINELSEDNDKMYLALMDERESVHNSAFYAVQELFKIAHSDRGNDHDPEYIKSYGEDVIQKGYAFGHKLKNIKDEFLTKKGH